MSPRSLPSIPLIRKSKFPGSPSTRDVKPEHKYLVRANRRLLTQQILTKPFKLLFNKERVEERECREKIQEEVVDYRGSGQSPKRKVTESTTIRSLTRSLCSLPRRARPTKIFINFDVAMDDDNDDDMDLDNTLLNLDADADFEMGDSSFDMDVDVKTQGTTIPIQFITGIPGLVYQPFVPSITGFPGLPGLVYPPFVPPQPEISELVQLMSALYVTSSSPPPPHAPALAPAMPAQAPSFPPGLHVPAAEASKAAKAEEAAPLAAAPVANGAAFKGKVAQVVLLWSILRQQRRASQAAEQGPSETSTPASAPAAAAAGSSGEDTEVRNTTTSDRRRRTLVAVFGEFKKACKNKDKGF
ncbi:hypothetical protein PsYK624_093630 [Phanerochaete sordida]|uniref:Uncharacterized protein n=1 Tax=Phanerochaete sordida TaxID=48140 RepID=A0A9P3LG16_9APHY|nr:hypothetical protein PsYK624_093630 [Phanerochaete sordida]